MPVITLSYSECDEVNESEKCAVIGQGPNNNLIGQWRLARRDYKHRARSDRAEMCNIFVIYLMYIHVY